MGRRKFSILRIHFTCLYNALLTFSSPESPSFVLHHSKLRTQR
jgi:hypothetical protein